MALIKCPECGKECSSEARACPSCGKAIAPVGVFNFVMGIVAIIYGLLFSDHPIISLLAGGVFFWLAFNGKRLEVWSEKTANEIEAGQHSSSRAVDAIKSYLASKKIRPVALILGVWGVALVYHFLNSPIEDASPAQGLIGLLFVAAAIYLGRDALRPKATGTARDRARLKWHLIVSALVMLLSGVYFVGALVLEDVNNTSFEPDAALMGAVLVFLLATLCFVGAAIWSWWIDRNLPK